MYGKIPAPEKQPEQKPFQFHLQHLFFLTLAAALVFGGAGWLGTGGGCFVLFLELLAFIAWDKRPGETVAFLLVFFMLFLLVFPVILITRRPYRMPRSNNLKQIALALHQYESDYGSFPPAYIADEKGHPMHSWRVLILPYLDQQSLHDLYDFDEPWDGPHNSLLNEYVLDVYICSSDRVAHEKNETSYLAIVGPETLWPGEKHCKAADIQDGASNTLLLVEVVDSGIHWMEPRDLDFSKIKMEVNFKTGRGIPSYYMDGVHAAFADGSIRFLSDSTPPEMLRALITASGGEPIPQDY